MTLRLKTLKLNKLIALFALVLGTFVLVTIIHNPKVNAYALNNGLPGDTNTCGGIASGSGNDLAGVVINLQYQDASGGVHQIYNRAGLRVSVSDITGSPGIAQMPDGWNTTGNHYYSASFSVDGFGCDYWNSQTVLGHGYTSCNDGFYGWCKNTNSWALICGELTFGKKQSFNIQPTGTPVEGVAGGYWDTTNISPSNGTTAHIVLTYHNPIPPPIIIHDDNAPTISGSASCTNKDIESIYGYDADLAASFSGGALPVSLYINGVIQTSSLGYNSKFSMASLDQTQTYAIKLVAHDYQSDGSLGWRSDAVQNITYGPCAEKVSGHVGYYVNDGTSYSATKYYNLSGYKIDLNGTCTLTNASGYYSSASPIAKNAYFYVRLYSNNSPGHFCDNNVDQNFVGPYTDYKYPGDGADPTTDVHYTCTSGNAYEWQQSLGATFTGAGGCPVGTPTISSNAYNFVYSYTPPIVKHPWNNPVSGICSTQSFNIGSNFDYSIDINYAGKLQSPTITVSSDPANINPNIGAQTNDNVSHIYLHITGSSPIDAGAYTFQVKVSGGAGLDALSSPVYCNFNLNSFQKPYFQVSGGDIVSGSKWANATGENCTDNNPDANGDSILGYATSPQNINYSTGTILQTGVSLTAQGGAQFNSFMIGGNIKYFSATNILIGSANVVGFIDSQHLAVNKYGIYASGTKYSISYNNFNGSASSLAAVALGQISGFQSNRYGSNYGNSAQSDSASFGNNELSFLGNMLGSIPCSSVDLITPTINNGKLNQTPGSDYTISSSLKGTYFANSTATTPFSLGANTITNGQQITLYVNGNLSITGNITYNTKDWKSISDIPNLKLIVSGNIYISPDVTQLDGTYIAKGSIYDCSYVEQDFATTAYTSIANSGSYPNSGTGAQACYNNHLIVNGSFIANSVYLQRTGGDYTNGNGTIAPSPAEVFNYGPEDWLAPSQANTGQFEAIKDLPPVL